MIAAIAPVEGAQNLPCHPSSPVSVLVFHGTADRLVPFDGGSTPFQIGPRRDDTPVSDTVAFWVTRDACLRTPANEETPSLHTSVYSGCEDGTGVALYAIQGGHYCVAKVYTGGSWNPEEKAPMAEPGLNVHAGDCILAVGGEELKADDDIQRLLEGTAGHAISLHVASANGSNARDITVVPIRTEAALRNAEWIEDNQRNVDKLSGGKLAYVYLPDTGAGGFTNFNRFYFSQLDKQGAVIDERFNGGGQVADYIIEAMQRKTLGYWAYRYGAIQKSANASIPGPKVMIINEVAGSGGDAMPWLFHQEKVGTLIGKRTWGGLVGIYNYPRLLDGGFVTAPRVAIYGLHGQWEVENHGIAPDIEVENDPASVAAGHDPQLEKAVEVTLEALKKNPVVLPDHPPYPNYQKK